MRALLQEEHCCWCYPTFLTQPVHTLGTRIIYDRKFLLDCRGSPLTRTPLQDLPVIPGVTSPSSSSEKVHNGAALENNIGAPEGNTTVGETLIFSRKSNWCKIKFLSFNYILKSHYSYMIFWDILLVFLCWFYLQVKTHSLNWTSKHLCSKSVKRREDGSRALQHFSSSISQGCRFILSISVEPVTTLFLFSFFLAQNKYSEMTL